jgi:hypothetical protein
MNKSDLITKILNTAGLKGTARTAQRTKLKKLTVPQLKAALKKVQAKAAAQQKQQVKQQGKQQAKQQAKKRSTKKGKSRKSQKIPKTLKARANRIARGIAAGKIAAKQGKSKPSDYASGTPTERYQKFVNLYKGVRIPKKGAKKAPSIKDVYAAMPGKEGSSKFPYYLSRGYHVHAFNVGGGRGGPGMIRKIPGSSAPAFSSLTAAKQAAVAKFLNGKGAMLRGPGMAKKQVNLAAMQQTKKQAAAKKKARKSTKKKAASANRWW